MFINIIDLLLWAVCCSFVHSSDFERIMPYNFGYGVNDFYSGDAKEHKERTSQNGRTEGEYRWLQPNGLFRVVRYYVEGPSGFIAEVTEEEEPRLKNYMFSNIGDGVSLSGSHSQNSFFFKAREGSNLNPSGQRYGADRITHQNIPSLQYNAPLNLNNPRNPNNPQTNYFSLQQNQLISQSSQNFNNDRDIQSQSQYEPVTDIGQEEVNFSQEPNIPISQLTQNPIVNFEESPYDIINNKQNTQNLVATQNFVHQDRNVYAQNSNVLSIFVPEQNIQTVSGTNPYLNVNPKANSLPQHFESLKNINNETPLNQQVSHELSNEDPLISSNEKIYSNSQTTVQSNVLPSNVLNPEIIKKIIGKINLLPLEPVQSQLINPKVITSDILFSGENKDDINNSHEIFSKNTQGIIQDSNNNNFGLPKKQQNLITAADTFTPLRLNSGARIFIMNSKDVTKLGGFTSTRNGDLSKISVFDSNLGSRIRQKSNEERVSSSSISSYSTLDL